MHFVIYLAGTAKHVLSCCSEPELRSKLGIPVLSPGDGQDLCFLCVFCAWECVSSWCEQSHQCCTSQKKAKCRQLNFKAVSKGSVCGNDNFLVLTNILVLWISFWSPPQAWVFSFQPRLSALIAWASPSAVLVSRWPCKVLDVPAAGTLEFFRCDFSQCTNPTGRDRSHFQLLHSF